MHIGSNNVISSYARIGTSQRLETIKHSTQASINAVKVDISSADAPLSTSLANNARFSETIIASSANDLK